VAVKTTNKDEFSKIFVVQAMLVFHDNWKNNIKVTVREGFNDFGQLL